MKERYMKTKELKTKELLVCHLVGDSGAIIKSARVHGWEAARKWEDANKVVGTSVVFMFGEELQYISRKS
jgi:hypothetical protein